MPSANGVASGDSMKSRQGQSLTSSLTSSLTTMGLDLSLTGTGLVMWDHHNHKVRRSRLLRTAPLSNAKTVRGLHANGVFFGSDEERIDFIVRPVLSAYRKFSPLGTGVEQYAFSKFSRALSGLHELGGVVKHRLFRKSALVLMPTPNEIKEFATGNGNASKDEMVAAALEVWPWMPRSKEEDNLADALHIARWTAVELIKFGE